MSSSATNSLLQDLAFGAEQNSRNKSSLYNMMVLMLDNKKAKAMSIYDSMLGLISFCYPFLASFPELVTFLTFSDTNYL